MKPAEKATNFHIAALFMGARGVAYFGPEDGKSIRRGDVSGTAVQNQADDIKDQGKRGTSREKTFFFFRKEEVKYQVEESWAIGYQIFLDKR